MVQKLPISDFKWSTPMSRDEIMSWNVDGDKGCLVEVDLSIPETLHDKFNCYPLAPEPLDITENMASSTSLDIREKRNGKATFSCTKLAPNLFDKKKYISHIRNLQFYLEEGVVLEKVHRVLEFRQVCYNKKIIFDYFTLFSKKK